MTMYNHSSEQDEEEMDIPSGGLRSRFGRWMDHLTGRVDDEETYEEQVAVQATRPATPATTVRRDTFRVASMRESSSITVMPVTSFADVQKAADRLKSGEPQIINLEKTPPDVAERLIDFLNGVTYALDGFVEKISEGAYLFTPSFISIQTDGPDAPQPKNLFDRL